jgi:hypothetical protein
MRTSDREDRWLEGRLPQAVIGGFNSLVIGSVILSFVEPVYMTRLYRLIASIFGVFVVSSLVLSLAALVQSRSWSTAIQVATGVLASGLVFFLVFFLAWQVIFQSSCNTGSIRLVTIAIPGSLAAGSGVAAAFPSRARVFLATFAICCATLALWDVFGKTACVGVD